MQLSARRHYRRLFPGTLAGHWLALFGLFAAIFCMGELIDVCQAESVRVTTWNVGFGTDLEHKGADLNRAAMVLRALDPDVILLQDLPDWRTCIDLTQLLKPADYRVVICSAFQGTSVPGAAQPQVAILSKGQAYFTWTESWPGLKVKTAGGMAFAAIQTRTQRLGFFTALADPEQTGEDFAREVLADLNTIKGWETNQVQTFVIAASAGSLISNPTKVVDRASTIFEQSGLVDASEQLSEAIAQSDQQRTQEEKGDCLFAGPNGFPEQTVVERITGFKYSPLTCNLELARDKVALALDIRDGEHREREARTNQLRKQIGSWTVGGIGVCLLVGAIARKRARKPVAISPPTVVRPPVRPKGASSSLRPIIFVESPAKGQGTRGAPAVTGLKPALRLQRSSRPTSMATGAWTESTIQAAHNSAAGQGHLDDHHVFPDGRQSSIPTQSFPVDSDVRRGVIQELAGWLKHKFVRRLMRDREQMMHAQQLATRMASTLDNRLANIEAQIQKQNQAYLRRIDELNRELEAAREENRELIRERIAQVKAEMEAARARALAEANLNNTTLRL